MSTRIGIESPFSLYATVPRRLTGLSMVGTVDISIGTQSSSGSGFQTQRRRFSSFMDSLSGDATFDAVKRDDIARGSNTKARWSHFGSGGIWC